ncbi:hypothetical protein [Streptomyces sp. NPDC091215]|uniref:hypothetical protein n=1 Tax=Streptomyces sp. NPDC091215 TaxID=3155192 RepID=UPI003427A0F0
MVTSRWDRDSVASAAGLVGPLSRLGAAAPPPLRHPLADGGIGLVQSASLLISDLLQHYGHAEPAQITRDGSIIAAAGPHPSGPGSPRGHSKSPVR